MNILVTVRRSAGLLCAFALAACGPKDEPVTEQRPPFPIATPELSVPSLLSQEQLAALFATSTATVFQATTADKLLKLTGLNGAKLGAAPNGLKITIEGTDPQLLLPPFLEGNKCILQVVINSPVQTPLQVYYSLREHRAHNEAQSQTVQMKEGENIVYFQLDHPDLVDPLRLDPGATPTEFTLRSLIARAMPP